MFQTQTANVKNPAGDVVTRHLEGAIVETAYRGHCSAELVRSVLAITPDVLREVPGTCWLLDMTAATATDAGASGPGADILRLFRERGGDQFAVVVSSGALKMMLMAVAFAAGLPLKVFERRDEALRFLRSRAPASPPAKPTDARPRSGLSAR